MTEPTDHGRASLAASPQISAAFLADQGFGLDVVIVRSFQSNGLITTVEKEVDGLVRLFTIIDGQVCVQDFDFDRTGNGATFKWYFTCPVTEQACSTIYFHHGCWASRYAHRIRTVYPSMMDEKSKRMVELRDLVLGTAEKGPARGAKLTAALSELREELGRLGIVPNSWWELQPSFAEGEARTRKARRLGATSSRRHDTTLDFAIRCGGMADHAEVQRYKAAGHVESDLPLTAGPPAPKQVTDAIEDHACIDMQTLRERNWLDPGYTFGWRLKWPSELCGRSQILMFVDMRECPTLVFEFSNADGTALNTQRVAIVFRSSMPGRLFFRCPVQGTEHGELYLRNGYFASSKAHRLKHRSQL